MKFRSKFPVMVVSLAVAGAATGFIGHGLQDPFWAYSDPRLAVQAILDALYATVRLFVLEAPKTVGGHTAFGGLPWLLINIARFAAPLSLAGALVGAISSVWRPVLARAKMRRMRDHTIIFGAGAFAQNFIRTSLNAGEKLACLVPIAEQKADLEQSFGRDVSTMVANPNLTESWHGLAVARCANILLVADDDQANLAAMKLLKSELSAAQHLSRQVRMFVHIEDERLLSELASQHGYFAGTKQLEIQPFSVNGLASRAFFHRRDFFFDTMVAGFERVHWLIYGFNNASVALMRQFLRVSAYSKLKKPRISLFASDVVAAQTQIRTLFGADFELAHFHIFALDARFPAPDLELCETIEADDPVSAIFISLGADGANQKLATLIAGNAQRTGHLRGAIYTDQHGGGDPLYQPLSPMSDCCSLTYLNGSYDQVARRFHLAYQQSDPKGVDWHALEETYKQSNRRAADHAKTKMEDLGFVGDLENLTCHPSEPDDLSEENLERLAQLEHQSWLADRMIGGWKYSPFRDDAKRMHPSLRVYEDLSLREQKLDLDQVQLFLTQVLKQGANHGQERVVRVGLIGHNRIDLSEAEQIRTRLQNTILPSLAEQNKHRKMSFFSPLAPGSDLVATSAVLENFASLHDNWEMRHVVSMPLHRILSHYAHNWLAGNSWNGVDENGEEIWKRASQNMADYFGDLVGHSDHFGKAINLMPAYGGDEYWDQPAHATAAFVRSGNYMADSADILIAYSDPARDAGVGGTAHSIERAQSRGIQVILI